MATGPEVLFCTPAAGEVLLWQQFVPSSVAQKEASAGTRGHWHFQIEEIILVEGSDKNFPIIRHKDRDTVGKVARVKKVKSKITVEKKLVRT